MNQTADFELMAAKSIEAALAVQQSLLRDNSLISSIARVSEILLSALRCGNKLLLFGNGAALPTPSTWQLNLSGGLLLTVPHCRPWLFR